MLCEKCGKSNISDLAKCTYCGAEMPKTAGGGGFADILSCNSIGDTTPPSVIPPRKYTPPEMREDTEKEDTELEKLMKKTDNIKKAIEINALLSLIAIGLSILILISSIIFGIVTISNIKGYKEETIENIEKINNEISKYKIETLKQLDEYEIQIDKIIQKLENKDKVVVQPPLSTQTDTSNN